MINTIQVGGHAATVIDHEIPASYGLRQTIGDTLGIGGIFRTLRTVAGDARHRRRHGRGLPGRLAAQLHEPDGDALPGRLPGHAAEEDRRPLPLGAGHDARARRPVSASRSRRSPSSAPGVNHQAFILRFERDGENLYPRSTRRSSATPSCCGACASTCTGGSATSRPSRASTPPSTSPWFMRHDDADRALPHPGRRVRRAAARGEPGRVRARQGGARDRRAARRSSAASEYAPLIIHSIETGKPRVIYGNVRNASRPTNEGVDKAPPHTAVCGCHWPHYWL